MAAIVLIVETAINNLERDNLVVVFPVNQVA